MAIKHGNQGAITENLVFRDFNNRLSERILNKLKTI